jgi:hypothetical protein
MNLSVNEDYKQADIGDSPHFPHPVFLSPRKSSCRRYRM